MLAAVVHLVPLVGVLGAGRLVSLYGVRVEGPNLSILLRRSIAENQTDSHLTAISDQGRDSSAARSMILSSMSVMFDTRRTSTPRHPRYRRMTS